ncbi:MAG: DUF11 domain-containing protein, partial [Caldilineales bacterium]|nr:DUF11 domain-containing protein [Caldilineales bacterium]
MKHRRFNRPSRPQRFRRVLHMLITLGMLLQVLLPVPAAAAEIVGAYSGMPAPDGSLVRALGSAGIRAPQPVAASNPATALGESLTPGWMNTGAPGDSTASGDVLGEQVLPKWMLGTSGQNQGGAGAASTGLGNRIVPNWMQTAAPKAGLAPAGQCTPSSKLRMLMVAPPYPVSRGNVAGDVYTVTVKNNGTITTTAAALQLDPSAGFYYVGGSASASSDVDGALTISPDPDTTAPDAPFTLPLAGPSPNNALGPGETIVFTFKLATDANAKSGQPLVYTLQSVDAPTVSCLSRRENIQTVRGNFVAIKSPSTQFAEFGDPVTWTVTALNNGLGNVYNGIITDTSGSGLANVSLTPAPSPLNLAPDTFVNYEVTAIVASCTNLTNTVAGAWSIGNQDGSGTHLNPVGETADIVFDLADPDVSVEISPIPQEEYCGDLDTTLTVTVTNVGAAARNLRLLVDEQNLNITAVNSADWVESGGELVYQVGQLIRADSTVITGTLFRDESKVFTVDVETGSFCGTNSASLSLAPAYQDACLFSQLVGDGATSTADPDPLVPTVNLAKTVSPQLPGYNADDGVVIAGVPFAFNLTLYGENLAQITGGIVVTDSVPGGIDILSLSGPGTAITVGNQVNWDPPTTPNLGDDYSFTLDINSIINGDPNSNACVASTPQTNIAYAMASVCPECNLDVQDDLLITPLDFLDPFSNTFAMEASPLELCSTDVNQVVTTTLDISSGITWTNTIYTDTLGRPSTPFFASNVTVIISNTDYSPTPIDVTSDVTITIAPTLTIDFGNLGNTSPFTPFVPINSQTQITITYNITGDANTLPTSSSSDAFLFAEFRLDGPAQACDGSQVGSLGTRVSLARGDLDINLAPSTLDACTANAITLTVTGGTPDLLTDNIVVTFTATANDVYTPTAYTLGGGFTGQTPTVLTSTLLSGAQLVTYTFPSGFALTDTGTISFPFERPCGFTGPMLTQVDYQDLCDTPHDANDSLSPVLRNSDLLLFVTPNQITLNSHESHWRFFVKNQGEIPASTTYVTNTLPAGQTYVSFTAEALLQPAIVASITAYTGTNISGREVVTFTIPETPGIDVGTQIQFDVYGKVVSCATPSAVDIVVFQECGQAGGLCDGRLTGFVEFLPGKTSILSSNNQTANLPLCQEGEVLLVIKNTSPRSNEYDFVITDFITNGLYIDVTPLVTVTDSLGNIVTGTTSGLPLAGIPFAPTSVFTDEIAYTSQITWELGAVGSPVSGTAQYDVLAERDSADTILILFTLRVGCHGDAVDVQSAGQARDVCDDILTFAEDSQALVEATPGLELTKVGYNVTRGETEADAGAVVFADAGDTVVWLVDVENIGNPPPNSLGSRSTRATNLFVTDTVPSNFSIVSANTVKGYAGNITSGAVDWGDAGGSGGLVLEVDEILRFVITGTIGGAVCSLDAINTGSAAYACSTSDVCLDAPVEAEATLRTLPTISGVNSTGRLSTCGGTLTINVPAVGPDPRNVIVTDTLPAGFVYAETIAVTPASALAALTSSPSDGDNAPIWEFSSIPGNDPDDPPAITQIIYRVRNVTTSGVCTAQDDFNNQVDIEYDDSCTNGPYTASSTVAILVDQPGLAVSKQPTTNIADVGDIVTWTLTVTNTGAGVAVAPNIAVTDVVDSGFINVQASNGSGGNEATTTIIAGNVVTWTPAFTLPVSGVWTAQVWAEVQDSITHTNYLEVSGECGDGCVYDTDTDTAFVTLLERFDKGPEIITDTIGSTVVFTFSVSLPDTGSSVYESVILTDTLPVGLGYIASAITYTVDIDGSNGGPNTTVSTTPTSVPAIIPPGASTPSGEIIWDLGDLQGSVLITGTITATIQNILANQQGVRLTNELDMTYTDDGQDYAFNDSADVDIVEPTLIIEKSVLPVATVPGQTVFYDIRFYHAPTSTMPAYNVHITDVIPAGLNYIPGSWQLNMPPASITGALTDTSTPQLGAYFSVVTPTFTAANPVRLRYAAVVDPAVLFGAAFTNTVTTTWTSIPNDPFDETRTGAGGIDDYEDTDDAVVSIDDVSIDKTGPLTITAGSEITYLLTVYNVGPFLAVDAIVTDTMPFQVNTSAATYVVPTVSSGACSITPNVSGDIVECFLGDIPNAITATILITGTVDPDTPLAADLTNSAEFTILTPDGRNTNNTITVETEVYTEADVGVEKTGPSQVNAGETVSYTIVLDNSGPSVARDVDVKDLLPPGFTYVGGTSTQGTCVSSICQLGDVGVGDTITMVITATAGSDITGNVTNVAEYFGDTNDPNPANDSDDAQTTVNALTALQISKIDLTDPVYAGNTYLYEIVVTNTGPSDAQNVVVTDTLPGEVSFEGASPECTHDGSPSDGTVTCNLGALLAGESRDFLINVRVDSAVVSGTVGLNTTGIDTTTPIDQANSTLTDTEQTTFLQVAGTPTDLQLTKTVVPGSAIAGSGRFTYTLVVRNNGPAPANAVQVVDAFPSEFDFISATASDGSLCNSGVTCDLGVMANQATVTITIVADVPADVDAGAYTNTAYVGSASPDSNLNNNADDAQSDVTNLANLELRKVANPATAIPGEDLTYTILVTNTGPSDAANVMVSDTIPADFTLALVLSSQGGCANLPCNLGVIPAGGNATVTINGAVASDAAAGLINTATVSSTTPGSGDSDTLVTPLAVKADLAIIKTATPTVLAGEDITYTLTVYNLGPSDAAGVSITDILPASVTVQSTGGCTDNLNGTLTCNVGALAVGASQTFTIVVRADAGTEPGTSLENKAVVTSLSIDENPTNDQSFADTSIVSQADLVLSKDGPGAVTAGKQVTYTIVVTNTGPGVAQSVDVKDTLPPGVSLDDATIARSGSGPAACGGVICQAGDMVVGEVITITVVGTVDPSVPDGAALTNSATVFSDSQDPETGNNSDTAQTTVNAEADIDVTKVDLTDPVAPGGGVLYEIVVSNDGPSDAQNVVVTDTLDGQISFSGASSGCVHDGSPLDGDVVCTVGTLAAGTSKSFLIAGLVVESAQDGDTLTNDVVATTSTTDPTPDNSDSVTTTVEGFGNLADVVITKDTAQSDVTAGELITYTLTVTNAGPSTATNVQVLELVPAGTTVVSLTPTNPDFLGEFCSLGGACYLGTVFTNTTATIEVVLEVNGDFDAASLTNSASVNADQQDPDTSNNFDDVTTAVETSADLSIAKSDLSDPVIAGELLLYQIVVSNEGPSDAQNVVVTDTLDANTEFAGASPGCVHDGSPSNGVVTCTVGTLAAGDSTSLFIEVRVDEGIASPTSLSNTANVSSDTSDPDAGNNSDTEGTTANPGAVNPTDLEIAKGDDPDPVTAGESLTYTLVVTNNGPSIASNVRVIDALPTGVTFVSATASQGLCSGGIECDLGDLGIGATATITIVVQVKPGQTTDLLNTARVSASNPDNTPGNNQVSEPTTVETEADVSITKSASPNPAVPGGSLSYEIVVSNAGPSDAQNVVVTDTLPTELTGVSFSASQGSCGGNSCNLGVIPAGGSATISVIGTVSPDASAPFTNSVEVDSDTFDPNTGNNEAEAGVTLTGSADLALTKVDAVDPVQAGTKLLYTLTVENRGPSAADNVLVTDTLPFGVTFDPANSSPNTYEPVAGTVVFTATQDPFPANGSEAFTLTVDVDPDLPLAFSLVNKAIVGSDTPDIDPDNNRATEDTEVLATAVLSITKLAPSTVDAGTQMTYTIVITNNGPARATDVRVIDTLPPGDTFV